MIKIQWGREREEEQKLGSHTRYWDSRIWGNGAKN